MFEELSERVLIYKAHYSKNKHERCTEKFWLKTGQSENLDQTFWLL